MAEQKQQSPFDEDLEEVYRNRRDWIQAVAARAGNDDSADLVQDAFLKALELGQTQQVKSPLALLLHMVRNGVIDKLRRRRRWSLIIDEGELSSAYSDPTPGPERAVLASDRLRRVFACIDSMPRRRREIFLLHRIEGMTYVQIAKRLDISPKTVEANIAKAMAQLSRDLGKDAHHDE